MSGWGLQRFKGTKCSKLPLLLKLQAPLYPTSLSGTLCCFHRTSPARERVVTLLDDHCEYTSIIRAPRMLAVCSENPRPRNHMQS